MKLGLRFLLLPFLLLFGMTYCGCGASQRERTIKATLVAVNETRDAFVSFDQATQLAIVQAAPTYERGTVALHVYRSKREAVVEAFELVYRAIATAATLDDDPSLATMLAAARSIATAFNALKQGEYAP